MVLTLVADKDDPLDASVASFVEEAMDLPRPELSGNYPCTAFSAARWYSSKRATASYE